LVPATSFQTYRLGLEQIFKKTGTYVDVDAQILKSDGTKTVGILTNSNVLFPEPNSPSSTHQRLQYEEKSLIVALNQLVGKQVSLGLRYQLTHADLHQPFIDIAPGTTGLDQLNPHVLATLHQVYLYANWYHPWGFFGQFNSVWSAQSNHGYSTPLADSDFWQFNIFAGYRFLQRRVEAGIGVLNLT